MTVLAVSACSRDGCLNETDRVLCAGCERAVTGALGELPALYTALHGDLPPGRPGGEHVTGSREPPAPLRVGHSALMTDMAGTCEDWEDTLRDAHRYTPRPDRGREGVRLAGSSRWLSAHLEQLLTHEVGLTGCDEIRRLRSRARAALGLNNPPDRLPAPCPDCDHYPLIRHQGAGLVLCTYCGRQWTEQDYDTLVRWLAWENSP